MPHPKGVRSRGGSDLAGRARLVRAELLSDAEHYHRFILARVLSARVSVWVGTANLKAMLVEAPIGTRARARGAFVSFYEALAGLARGGVDVRILHASPPSRPLARQMGRPRAAGASGTTAGVVLRQCPRVHLKMIAVDGASLYLGSANVTGAGLGAKGEGRRNFELGIVTDDTGMLDRAQERFDSIWRGRECGACKLRAVCPKPLDQLGPRPPRATMTKGGR